MGSLLEMTANIVSSHASKTTMLGDELIQELQKVHASLQRLEEEKLGETLETAKTDVPAMSLKKAFRPDQVFCLICGKGGRNVSMTLRHLPFEFSVALFSSSPAWVD